MLELAGGRAFELGIAPGDRVEHAAFGTADAMPTGSPDETAQAASDADQAVPADDTTDDTTGDRAAQDASEDTE